VVAIHTEERTIMTAAEAAHTLRNRLAPHLDQDHPLACIGVGGMSETDPPGLFVMVKTRRYARELDWLKTWEGYPVVVVVSGEFRLCGEDRPGTVKV
jgi:hypothetical protein